MNQRSNQVERTPRTYPLDNVELSLTPRGTALDFGGSRMGNSNNNRQLLFDSPNDAAQNLTLKRKAQESLERPVSKQPRNNDYFRYLNEQQSGMSTPPTSSNQPPSLTTMQVVPSTTQPIQHQHSGPTRYPDLGTKRLFDSTVSGQNLEKCVLCLAMVAQLKVHYTNYHNISQMVCFKPVGHDVAKSLPKQAPYKLTCYHCLKVYETPIEVKACRGSHGTFYCEFCPVSKNDFYDMTEHRRVIHKMPVQFPCKICDAKPKTKQLLLQHQRRCHQIATNQEETTSKNIKIQCKNCEAEFTTNTSLKRHLVRAEKNPETCIKPSEKENSTPTHPSDSPWVGEPGDDVQSSSQKSTEGMFF